MNESDQASSAQSRKRPALVWVVSIFYFVSAGFVVLSFALIHSGSVPLTDAQKQYFQSQSILEYGSSLIIGAANFTAAGLLLALRKVAFYIFAVTFGAGIVFTAYQILTENWLGVIGGGGFVGAIIGWGISIAVILCTKRLIDRGILR